jgi:2-amino-4-hydroxy-6-hydroxymethyldihydropteridine diphosphokinase
MELVILGLGSNREDSRGRAPGLILESAVDSLDALLSGMKRASLYKTRPLHLEDQPPFYNTAVSGFCSCTPRLLLDALHRIEAAHERDRARERRCGERTLDIDILLFGDQVLSCAAGAECAPEIPHPRLKERAFALIPLLELLPDAKDPVSGVFYRTILANLGDQGVEKINV